MISATSMILGSNFLPTQNPSLLDLLLNLASKCSKSNTIYFSSHKHNLALTSQTLAKDYKKNSLWEEEQLSLCPKVPNCSKDHENTNACWIGGENASLRWIGVRGREGCGLRERDSTKSDFSNLERETSKHNEMFSRRITYILFMCKYHIALGFQRA